MNEYCCPRGHKGRLRYIKHTNRYFCPDCQMAWMAGQLRLRSEFERGLFIETDSSPQCGEESNKDELEA